MPWCHSQDRNVGSVGNWDREALSWAVHGMWGLLCSRLSMMRLAGDFSMLCTQPLVVTVVLSSARFAERFLKCIAYGLNAYLQST